MLTFMTLLAFLSNLGGPDLILILLIILVLFGAKKLPELARGMGQAMREFQKAKDEVSDELHGAGKPQDVASVPTVATPAITGPPPAGSVPPPSSAKQVAPDGHAS